MKNTSSQTELKKQPNKLLVDVHQIPKSKIQVLLFSFQHVLAMFGSNILGPILINSIASANGGPDMVISPQLAFFGSGLGTIIYMICTKFEVPIYLGSSFAYVTSLGLYYATTGYSAFIGIITAGVVYVIVASIISVTKGSAWIKKLLAPIVIGPAIMMIGLSLMGNAIGDAGFTGMTSQFEPAGGDTSSVNMSATWSAIAISVGTLGIVVCCILLSKGIFKIIPILVGLVGGIIIALIVMGFAHLGQNSSWYSAMFNTDKLTNTADWKWYPDVGHMWQMPYSYNPAANQNSLTPNSNAMGTGFHPSALIAIAPLAIVTIAEHIGDHTNIGAITNRDFIGKNPGVHRTLMGDGLATIVSASMGGAANTSYGENTSVVAITKVASVWVIFGAAIIAICISFLAPLTGLIFAIPKPVLGGIEIVLFGMIASNGLRLIISDNIDMSNIRNIVIFSVLMAFGLGGAVLIFSKHPNIALMGNGVAVIVGVILNVILPEEKEIGSNVITALDLTPLDVRNMFIKKKKEHFYTDDVLDHINKEKVKKQKKEVEDVKNPKDTKSSENKDE